MHVTNLTEANKGCLMLNLWERDAVNVVSWAQKHIPQSSLTESGYEREPHVTVLYGFLPSVDPDEVVDEVTGFGPVAIRLGKISRFSNENYDVIKVDVSGDSIHDLHHHLRRVFEDRIELSFHTFNPHLTLAYVKKGSCLDLDSNAFFEGHTFVFDIAVYSTPDQSQKYLAVLSD